jgi:hypothetical protein
MSEKERLVEELPQSDTKSTGRQSSPTEHVKDQAHHTASTSSRENIGEDIEATIAGTDVSAIKETGEHYVSEAANYAHAAYNHVEEHAPTPEDVLPDEQAQQARNRFASAQSKISNASSRIKSFLAKTIDSYGLHEVLLSLSVATLCTLSLTGLFALPSPILITKSSSIEGLGIQQAIWLAITIVAALTTRKAPSIAMVESLGAIFFLFTLQSIAYIILKPP